MKRSPHTSTPRFWLLFSLLLMVSLACSLPALERAAQTPPASGSSSTQPAGDTGSGTAEASQPPASPQQSSGAGSAQGGTQAPSADFPPALVEADPAPSSQVALDSTPVFYFNQPMDRASVESALRVEPDVPGKLEWLDDATARFVPSQPFQPDTELSVIIETGARSAGGKNLLEDVQLSYRSAGALRLGERLPAPGASEVNPASAVVVTFNAPVVPLGDDPASGPQAVTLEPAVDGEGQWINTSTYIFYPRPAMLGGAEYTVRLNPQLKSLDGAPLAEDTEQEWSFSTARPVLLSIEPSTEQPLELDDVFVLTFNQPMDPASVEADFALLGGDGGKVAGSFTWNENHTQVTYKPEKLLERGSSYTLVLFGTAKSQGGAQIGADFAASLASVPQFGVTQTRPAAGEGLSAYDGFATINLTFGSPVAGGQDLKSLITITPEAEAINVTRSIDGYQVFISGYFKPSSSYTLTVSPDLQDQWGARLGSPFRFTFSTQPASPRLVIPVVASGATSLFVPYGETSLPAYSTNVTRLALSRGPLTLPEFIQATQDWQGLQNWQSKVKSSWARLLYPARDVTEQIGIPLSQTGDLLPAGLYFLNVDTQPAISETPAPPYLVVVSPIQMLLKASRDEAFVWATYTADFSPAAGRPVTIYDQTASAVATCTTDEQGVCRTPIPPRPDDFSALFAVIGQPGEPEFSLAAINWAEGVAPWEFQLPYRGQRSEPEIYLYTDRPIYRPGQAVHFRAVVREQDNGRYATPDFQQLVVEVVSPYDPLTSQSQVLTTLALPLSPYGTATGVYTLPEDARPGTYTLRPLAEQFDEIYFEVAEYRKPEIDLQVSFDQQDQLAGSDVVADVEAHYFFGAPAANQSVRWSLFRTVRYPDLLAGMSTGRVDTTWLRREGFFGGQEVFVMEGQGQTDVDGRLTIQIDGEDMMERIAAEDGTLLDLTLEVTVEDESGLPVSARDMASLHPAPSYVGVRPEQWTVEAGDQMTFFVRAVDWKDNPLDGQQLRARFRKVVFVPQAEDPYGPGSFRAEYTDAGSTDFITSDAGEARLAFTPDSPGTYMIEVTNEEGAVAQHIVWVGGAGSASWPSLPNQHIQLSSDKEQYQPGQTARIFIPNPFEGGAQALVTVERGRIMRTFLLAISGASHELELPLAEEDAPNVYVSVTLLGRTAGRPDFRQGYLELAVDPAAELLNVELLASPAQAQPGEQVAFQLRVTNAAGDPVQGEFSLALVDKAVLALANPNALSIQDAFYSRQPLGVQTGLGLARYSGRFLPIATGRGGGGGAGDAGMPLTVRSEFQDTAFWNGAIETDENGIAQVVLTLPDNLTTWRADVRGVTVDTEVGQAQADLVTSKPLLIRPVTPRFAVQGDHLELAAVVHNNTPEALTASAHLEAPGFTFDDPDQAVQPVDVPPGGSVRVSWWGAVQAVPSLDMIFSVEAGDLEDAAQPERGPLPVLAYSAPQSFATAGVLEGAGEKVEWVNLPRSFAPTGGELSVELAPSLSAAVMESLTALEAYPHDFTEPVLSRLMPNLATLRALRELNLQDAALTGRLQTAISESVERLMRTQNEDGGWGWAPGYSSEPYISSYALFGLAQSGEFAFIDPNVLDKARGYLSRTVFTPQASTEAWQIDRLVFQLYALQQAGQTDLDLNLLYGLRDKLSPWGKAFLALTLEGQSAGDERARTLISDLGSAASRTATGAHWQDFSPAWRNWSTPNFTTAVVVFATARIDPAAPVLVDAMRYLALHRHPNASSYETAWVLLALIESARSTGDLQAAYSYAAYLNGSPTLEGQVQSTGEAINPATASLPLSNLRADQPNQLQVQRGEGNGRLYYRAFLRVDRPAQDAPALRRGLALTRRYYRAGQNCRLEDCQPVTDADLSDPQPLLVRLTLTVPEDMYYVVVEDTIPAGAEVLNPRLKTSQQYLVPEAAQGEEQPLPVDLQNPFEQGWGWWRFNDPQVQDERVRWVVDYLPAGTYELTYRLTPYLAGEFQLLPARAWQYYFPEVEAASEGGVLMIQ